MSQHISATARCGCYTSLSNTTNLLRLQQLIVLSPRETPLLWTLGFAKTRTGLCRLCHVDDCHLTRPMQLSMVDWLTWLYTCARWWSHHDAGVTCVLLDFGLFSTSNQRKCRHKNNSLTCSIRADRFWLRLFRCFMFGWSEKMWSANRACFSELRAEVGGHLLRTPSWLPLLPYPSPWTLILWDPEVVCRNGTKKSHEKSEPAGREEHFSTYL